MNELPLPEIRYFYDGSRFFKITPTGITIAWPGDPEMILRAKKDSLWHNHYKWLAERGKPCSPMEWERAEQRISLLEI